MKKAINPKTIESWYTKTSESEKRRLEDQEARLNKGFYPPDMEERLAAREKQRQVI